jgi:hypothetical protein
LIYEELLYQHNFLEEALKGDAPVPLVLTHNGEVIHGYFPDADDVQYSPIMVHMNPEHPVPTHEELDRCLARPSTQLSVSHSGKLATLT